MENENINQIAKLLTDDPDVFNEMAVSTGAIAIGMGQPAPRTRKHKKVRKKNKKEDEEDEEPQKHEKYYANPVTGQPEDGEILYSDIRNN